MLLLLPTTTRYASGYCKSVLWPLFHNVDMLDLNSACWKPKTRNLKSSRDVDVGSLLPPGSWAGGERARKPGNWTGAAAAAAGGGGGGSSGGGSGGSSGGGAAPPLADKTLTTEVLDMAMTARWWESYVAVQSELAKCLVRGGGEMGSGVGALDTVWVHDYHLMLLPKMVVDGAEAERDGAGGSRRPRLVFFLHCPFPTTEIFRALPTGHTMLHGVLEVDLVGFHVFDHARHFLNCATRLFGLSYSTRQGGNIGFEYGGRDVVVTINHVGIEAGWLRKQLSGGEGAKEVMASDAAAAAAAAAAVLAAEESSQVEKLGAAGSAAAVVTTTPSPSPSPPSPPPPPLLPPVPTWRSECEAIRRRHAGKKIIGSVTRLERLSGLAAKLLAFEQLLTAYPVWRDKVILVQRCIVRPTQRREAMRCADELAQLVRRIEARFGPVIDYQVYDANCPGVLFAGAIRGQGTLSLAQRLGLWAACDVFCDTSLRAGLDLMPIEYLLVRMHLLEERQKESSASSGTRSPSGGGVGSGSGGGGGGGGSGSGRGIRSGSRGGSSGTLRGAAGGSSTGSLGSTSSLEAAETGSARLGLAKRKPGGTAGGAGAGVIVMSEFSTMCNVLNGAMRTNPWSGSDVVSSLDIALTMAPEEQRARLARDEPFVAHRGTGRWFRSVLNDLEAVFDSTNGTRKSKQAAAAAVAAAAAAKKQQQQQQAATATAKGGRGQGARGHSALASGQGPDRDFEALDIRKVAKAYHACKGRRVFLVDYGGTLIGREASNLAFKSSFQVAAGVGRVPPRTEAALAKLCASGRDSVFVISGARRGKLNSALGHVGGLGLAAENGSMYSWAVGKQQTEGQQGAGEQGQEVAAVAPAAPSVGSAEAAEGLTAAAAVADEEAAVTTDAAAAAAGALPPRTRRTASYSNALQSSDLIRRRKGAVHVVVHSGTGLKDSSTWWSVGEQSPYVRATLTLHPQKGQTASGSAARMLRVIDQAAANTCVTGAVADVAVAAATASTRPCKGGGTAPAWTAEGHGSDLKLSMDLSASAKLPSSVLVLIEVMNKNVVQADALIGRASVQLPLLVGSEAPQELSVELDTGGTVQCSMFFVNDEASEAEAAAAEEGCAAAARGASAASSHREEGGGVPARFSDVGADLVNDGRVWQQMESDFEWEPVRAPPLPPPPPPPPRARPPNRPPYCPPTAPPLTPAAAAATAATTTTTTTTTTARPPARHNR